jgi:hypothetical protein
MRSREADLDVIHVDGAWSLPPSQPWDHPDWVLARAVAAAVIGPEEQLLIAATRLENVSLAVVADKLGISTATALSWRRGAELRLADAIRAGEITGILTTRRRSRAAGNSTAPAPVHEATGVSEKP